MGIRIFDPGLILTGGAPYGLPRIQNPNACERCQDEADRVEGDVFCVLCRAHVELGRKMFYAARAAKAAMGISHIVGQAPASKKEAA